MIRRLIQLFLLSVGAMIMVNVNACSGRPKYEKYSSKDTELNIIMDHPAGWSYRETRGALGAYANVGFYEPSRKGKAIKASIGVTTIQSAKAEFKPLTVAGAMEDLLSKRRNLSFERVLSQGALRIFENDGFAAEIYYKLPDSLDNSNAKLIPLKERVVIFQHKEKFYIIRYTNTEKEFEKLSEAFAHCLESIKFKD